MRLPAVLSASIAAERSRAHAREAVDEAAIGLRTSDRRRFLLRSILIERAIVFMRAAGELDVAAD